MRCAQSHRPAEVTNSDSSAPNASSPNGPANDRDANPNRSLDGPALLRDGLRIGPGLPWPGQAERLGPRHWSALLGRRVSLSSCAFRPRSRTGAPNGARERLTQPERARRVMHAREGRRLRLCYCREWGAVSGRAHPPCKPSAINLGDDRWRCGGRGYRALQRHTPGPCRRRPWLGCVAAEGRSRRSARSSPTR